MSGSMASSRRNGVTARLARTGGGPRPGPRGRRAYGVTFPWREPPSRRAKRRSVALDQRLKHGPAVERAARSSWRSDQGGPDRRTFIRTPSWRAFWLALLDFAPRRRCERRADGVHTSDLGDAGFVTIFQPRIARHVLQTTEACAVVQMLACFSVLDLTQPR